MDYKKIILGLVGGVVAGYVYKKYITKPKNVLKVGAEASLEEEVDSPPMGGGGGGGGGGFAPSMDADEVIADEVIADELVSEPVLKPLIKPITNTNLADSTTSPVFKKPLKTPIAIAPVSKFSGIGGYSFEANDSNLDL